MADVQKEPLALLLAVVAEIDPRRSLFADDPAHRLASEPVEFGRVDRFASRPAHIEAGQLRRARQAAGMRRKDAVFAAAHCPSLSRCLSELTPNPGAAYAAIDDKIACGAAAFSLRWCPSSQQRKGGDPVSSPKPRSSAAVTRIPALEEILACGRRLAAAMAAG